MEYLFLIAGLFLLIKGADFFVGGASSIAARLRVPSLIIGLTIVSFGTSAPEAAIGISESIGGGGGISVGNVIGSNLFNLLIVIGITSLAIPLTAESDVIKRDMPVNIFSTGALAVAVIDGIIKRYEAALLLGALAVYLFFVITKALRNPIDTDDEVRLSWLLSLVYVIGGLFAVVVGGDVVVDNAKVIASNLGMSEALIGLTVVALGTSLPELVTAVTSLIKGHGSLSLGNIIGANLFNLVLVSGAAITINPFEVPVSGLIGGINSSLVVDIPVMLAVMLILTVPTLIKEKLSRWQGLLMLGIYAAFCVLQFIL